MKKVLLGTSALIAAGIIASPAAAQVELSIGGEIQFMAGVYSEENGTLGKNDHNHSFGTDAQFQLDVSGVSDTGIYYGGRIDLEDNGVQTLGVDEAWVYLSGGFGTVTLGNDDGANDIASNPPVTGVGMLDGDYARYFGNDPSVFLDTTDSSDATKIYYRTSGAGGAPGVAALSNNNIVVGVSYAPGLSQSLDATNTTVAGSAAEPSHSNFFEAGASWSPTFGSVTITPSGAISYAVTGHGANDDNWVGGQANLNVAWGGFAVGVGGVMNGEFVDGNGGGWGINTGATYTTGPWTFGLNYSFGYDDNVGGLRDTMSHTFGSGVEYKWLPGLDLEADIVGFTTEDEVIGALSRDNSGVVGITRVNLSF